MLAQPKLIPSRCWAVSPVPPSPYEISLCLRASAAIPAFGFSRHSPQVTFRHRAETARRNPGSWSEPGRHCLIQSQQGWIKLLRKLLKIKGRMCNQSQLILTHSTVSLPALSSLADHPAAKINAMNFHSPRKSARKIQHEPGAITAPATVHESRVTSHESRLSGRESRTSARSFARRCGSQVPLGPSHPTTHHSRFE